MKNTRNITDLEIMKIQKYTPCKQIEEIRDYCERMEDLLKRSAIAKYKNDNPKMILDFPKDRPLSKNDLMNMTVKIPFTFHTNDNSIPRTCEYQVSDICKLDTAQFHMKDGTTVDTW